MSLATASTSSDGGDRGDVKKKCYVCKATFHNDDALRNHKIKMRDKENVDEKYLTHIYCHYCDQDFMTARAGKEHWDQFHSEKQDINCPGCDKHFVHFSAFVHHVEFHECPVISQETAAARCQKELDFARALERIDRMGRGVNHTKDFTLYLDGDRGGAPTDHLPPRLAITDGQSASWPSDIEVPDKSEFPRLPNQEYYHGNTNVPDLLTGEETNFLHGKEGENPWASAQAHVPDAPPAQKPTQEQMMQLQLYNQEQENESEREAKAMARARGVVQIDPDDPSGRNFDPRRLLCPYTKMYKCPRCKKGKGFKHWPALKQHMESAAHAFTKIVACPCCKDNFKHLFALAAHVESADKKCQLKHSDIFEIFLGQLTWNLVEVIGEHKTDGTAKFAISKKAEQDYGVVKPAQSKLTFAHHQVHGPEPGTERPQLTSSAMSQLEKQANKPLPRFKAPQQRVEALRRSEVQQQFPPLHQGQPQQAQTQLQRVQNQAQILGQRSQAQYQQQLPSLQQQKQPQSSRVYPQAQGRYQSQLEPRQQQPPQRQAPYQLHSYVQQQSQSQGAQVQQQQARGLRSGLTELALSQVPAFPSEKPYDPEEAWSHEDDGDPGW